MKNQAQGFYLLYDRLDAFPGIVFIIHRGSRNPEHHPHKNEYLLTSMNSASLILVSGEFYHFFYLLRSKLFF